MKFLLTLPTLPLSQLHFLIIRLCRMINSRQTYCTNRMCVVRPTGFLLSADQKKNYQSSRHRLISLFWSASFKSAAVPGIQVQLAARLSTQYTHCTKSSQPATDEPQHENSAFRAEPS